MSDVGTGSSEETLGQQNKEYCLGQRWECRRHGEEKWILLPVDYKPGWFFDTQYRLYE